MQAEILEDFEILYIPEWGEKELAEYLKKRFGESWRKQLEKIQGTHNLQELAQTPLFLEMITDTLPTLGQEVRRYQLYDAYTGKWISEQSRRRGARLTKEVRMALVQEIAVKLYNENQQTYHYREFAPYLQKKFGITEAAKIDYLENDVRTCTFLTRNPDGNYGFRHNSFMEFFVAQSMVAEVRDNNPNCLKSKIVPEEIRGFAVEMMRGDIPIDTLRDWARQEKETTLRQNALAFLISLGIAVDDIPLSEDASGDEDMHLMTRFFQGDKGAFNTVFLSYSPILEKYLKMRYGRIAPREIIHDAVCDAFVKAVVKRETLMEINPKIFKEYLLKMGQNIIIDHIRKEKRKKESEMSLEGNIWGEPGDQILDEEPILLKDLVAFEGESPEETTSKFERTELVQKALGKLTSCERFIIEENVLGLSTNNEVAAKLKISIFKFQAIKRNAIQKLSKYLRDTWMR